MRGDERTTARRGGRPVRRAVGALERVLLGSMAGRGRWRARWRTVRRIWMTTGIAATILFALWNLFAYRARGVPDAVLASDARVHVTADDEALRFVPRGAAADRAPALLFFAGSLVDARAYAPFARSVAERGHRAVVVRLPWRGALGARSDAGAVARARAVMRAAPAGTRWVVGGHSRGGKVAVRLLAADGADVAALLLVATSHPRDADLSRLRLPVTKVYGTRDGLASEAEVRRFAPNLPPHTTWVRVEGGNHAGFARYGRQFGDHGATIGRDAQERALLAATLELLAAAR